MNLTQEDYQLALRISNGVQKYFRINYDKNDVRSPDIYEYLEREDFIEKDRHKGVFLRKFLLKLKQAGVLSLIPQCRWAASSGRSNEWHFIRMSDEKFQETRNKHAGEKALVSHRPKTSEKEIDELIELEKQTIEMLPKIDTSKLTCQQVELRKNYPRAYEIWTNKRN